MAQNDRTTGLVGLVGCKVPVRAATTAAIVLSGEQTVDGIALVTADRCLVKDQADGTENAIYVVDSGAWSRAPDFDGSYDIVRGSLIKVNEGNVNADGIFEITTADPITIGSTSLSFSRIAINYVVMDTKVAASGQTVFNLGINYQVGSNNLQVYVNGIRMRAGADYTETTSSRVTFAAALSAGDEVDFYAGLAIGNLVAAIAAAVAIVDAGDFYLGATVEQVFQELRDAITADVGDADAALTYGTSTPVQRWNTPLTAARTATLNLANAKEGGHFVIVRGSGATGNFGLAVGALATLRAPGEWAEVRYDAGSAAWVLEKYGILPSAEILAMSSDNGDASVNLTVGTSARSQRWASPITAERTAALQAVGYTGSRFRIERASTATGAFSLSVLTGTTVLARLAPGQWAEVEHTGAAWVLMGMGNLRQYNSALVELTDDFVGEEINGFRWQSLVGTDASVLAPIVLADQAAGVVRMVTGANAGATMALNGVQLHSQLNWRTDKGGLVWEGRVALSAITAVALFVGLTDQRAALEMPFTLGAGDALTSNASDACGVLFDTGADTDTWWLVGVKADVDAAKQNTAVAPVAGTFETWRIELDATGIATFYRNGTLVGAAMAAALTGAALLTPVIAAFSRGAASRNVDVDMVSVQVQR